MHIEIIEAGEPPPPLLARHGHYASMFEAMLSPLAPNWQFDHVSVFRKDAASRSKDIQAQGLLITGSPAGVYDAHSWIEHTQERVRTALRNNIPVVGICFGHQLMVQALGGRVEKSPKGWGVGVHTYDVTDRPAFMRSDHSCPLPSRISCIVSHQDQVVALPKGVKRIAGSPFCPFGILYYAQGPGLSMQFHPEFTTEFAQDLLAYRAADIPEEARTFAQTSYAQPTNRHLLAKIIFSFFSTHIKGTSP